MRLKPFALLLAVLSTGRHGLRAQFGDGHHERAEG